MQYRNLGKTDLKASVVSLGSWAIGGDSAWGFSDDTQSVLTIQKSLDLGINVVDTAPVYGFGHSEEMVGKAIAGNRDKYILQTKCGLTWESTEGTFHFARDGKTINRNLSPASIRSDLEASLLRMKTDYIDVYITHWQSVEPAFVPIEETMAELNKFIKEGKVRALGISNVTADHIREYAKYGTIALIQEKYSMLDPRIEESLMPVCKELGITVQAYSPLERGMLTGRIKADTQVEMGSAKNGIKWYQPENRQKVVDLIDSFEPLCKKYQCSVSNLVIAWTAAQMDNINVLCGARKLDQIEDNAKGGDIILSKEDVAIMTKAAHGIL